MNMTNSGSSINTEVSAEPCVTSTFAIYQPTYPNCQRVLGVPWNVTDDQLMFSLAGIAETAVRLEPTKRNVISLIGQIYDPLGFLSPVMVRFKILMQTLCKLKLGWDHPLEEDLLQWWNNLVNNLRQSQPMVLPRCYLSLSTNDTTIYVDFVMHQTQPMRPLST